MHTHEKRTPELPVPTGPMFFLRRFQLVWCLCQNSWIPQTLIAQLRSKLTGSWWGNCCCCCDAFTRGGCFSFRLNQFLQIKAKLNRSGLFAYLLEICNMYTYIYIIYYIIYIVYIMYIYVIYIYIYMYNITCTIYIYIYINKAQNYTFRTATFGYIQICNIHGCNQK